eukprot:TRINITY_DN16977_c0_g1_i1.p1 TRINITY_DN16977_c0_g1~~TRINITY_DN16977_c0_g1_i1.p1  ORF type:complete len:125 (-),score=36.60 TRINITY_DN16977_c0_g1_i1:202-576(-)
MRAQGVELSPYCIQRVLPSAGEMTAEADICDWLPTQADKSFDFVLVTCLEYMVNEQALETALAHIARITREGAFVVCVQSDVGDHYDELPVALLRAHQWWDCSFKQQGFLSLSKDEFVQFAPIA